MKWPLYMTLIEKLPDYGRGIKKQAKHNIQALMTEQDYDTDYIHNITDDFCQGFGVAKDIAVRLLKKEEIKQTQLRETYVYYFFRNDLTLSDNSTLLSKHPQVLIYSTEAKSKKEAIQNFKTVYPTCTMDHITIAVGRLFF